jgi:hypothetical protein
LRPQYPPHKWSLSVRDVDRRRKGRAMSDYVPVSETSIREAQETMPLLFSLGGPDTMGVLHIVSIGDRVEVRAVVTPDVSAAEVVFAIRHAADSMARRWGISEDMIARASRVARCSSHTWELNG